MKKIGFLGPVGTFSHEAAKKYARHLPNCELSAFPSIPDMLIGVDGGLLDEAILPIENSLEGGVIPTLDMFLEDLDVKIKSELTIPIHENLLVRKGASAVDIRTILSHSQPLGQCRKYLHENFRDTLIRSMDSTTAAAAAAAESDGSVAAIGSAAAGELYGLEILADNIQDMDNNRTRFVIVAKSDGENTGACKSSILFSTDHTPGRLQQILGIFNIWDINMTRIESRPSKKQLGEYVFYVDIDGHREDPDVRDALKMIRRKTTFYKFLGSYSSL